MNKVWIVQTGINFEGGGVDAVFSTKEAAVKWVTNYAQKENKEREEYLNSHPDKYRIDDTYYTERRWEYLPNEGETGWSNSTSYAIAEEWEVKNET